MTRLLSLLVLLSLLFVNHPLQAQQKANKKKDDDAITLERLFPEDSLFGPRASNIEFSPDGNFAAFLYRDYDERRHGNDLWSTSRRTR